MKKTIAATGLVCTLVSGTLLSPAHAAQRPTDCHSLRGLRLPASAIGLPTTGGEVSAANTIAPTGGGAAATGAYCRVDAVIHPVDPRAPDITLRVALPQQWNRKSMMFGGGGYDGTVPDVTGNVPFGPTGRPHPLSRGYATYAGDSGHQAAPDFTPVTSLDGSFGLNDEAVRNFAGDALKKTHDAARYIIRTYYGTDPAHTYFAGGSSGGREALAVAQRWPTDFDGVIAAYPAWNAAALNLFFGYEAQLLSRPGAFLNPAKQDLLYRGVIRSCDGVDGLRDGVISNEPGCRFQPRTLRCPGGKDTADTCLSDQQIHAAELLSSPLRWKYRLASGENSYPGFPFLSGADMTTPLLGMGTRAPGHPMPKNSGYGLQFWDQWVRYFVTRDPAHNSLDIDPRRPGAWQQRISRLSALQDVNDPDLHRFAEAGGKLLLLHGTADELVSHRSTIDYFQRVQKRMGPHATGAFARLYLIPGANHVNVDASFAGELRLAECPGRLDGRRQGTLTACRHRRRPRRKRPHPAAVRLPLLAGIPRPRQSRLRTQLHLPRRAATGMIPSGRPLTTGRSAAQCAAQRPRTIRYGCGEDIPAGSMSAPHMTDGGARDPLWCKTADNFGHRPESGATHVVSASSTVPCSQGPEEDCGRQPHRHHHRVVRLLPLRRRLRTRVQQTFLP